MRLNLIDGYGFVFRAFYALPSLTDAHNRPVGAIYGFSRMLLKLIESRKDERFLVALDSGKPTKRHKLYDSYKANRQEAPDDLKVQFPLIRQACQAFGVMHAEDGDFEADDIIASYARKAQARDIETVIISSDKDLMQLITPGISMWDPIKEKSITAEQVVEKFGVKPTQVVDILALMGDSSDNVPGVPGIGPKTAADLLQKFETLENLYAHLDEVPPSKRKESLIANKDLAFLSKTLVTLYEDAPTHVDFDDLTIKENHENIRAFLKEHNFTTLYKKYEEPAQKEDIVTDFSVFKEKALRARQFFFSQQDGAMHCKADNSTFVYEGNHFERDFADVLENPGITKIAPNIKDTIKNCMRLNIHLEGYHDTDVMRFCNQKSESSDLLSELMKLPVFPFYQKAERFLPEVLANMEIVGAPLDLPKLAMLKRDFEKKCMALQQSIYTSAGMSFNINSPKQLSQILFEKCQMPLSNKTKSGTHSTDVDVLQKLEKQGFELPTLLLKWRLYQKLLGTYIDPLLEKNENGFIHTTFSQVSTLTGRLASSNPNLQNIPVRSDEGKLIRECFIASKPSHKLVSLDYSQIELRLLAHFSNESDLTKAFLSGEDIHASTAKLIFGSSDEPYRRQAKMINFGIVYGISAHGLSENLQISHAEAQNIIDTYFKRFPGIKDYIDAQIKQARQTGFVETIFHRRMYIDDINSSVWNKKQFGERQAANAPLQGSNADIIKVAMVLIYRLLQSFKTTMILQVHDELVFDMPDHEIDTLCPKIVDIMENIVKLSVPLKVNISSGPNWNLSKVVLPS